MASDNLKDFGIEWILFGLLLFSMVSFSIIFINNNNEGALGNYQELFEDTQTGFQGRLIELEGESNSLLNISSQNNPEVSDLGSKDSVATSYNIYGMAKGIIGSFRVFSSWIFTDESSKIILSVFVGILALAALYFLTKWIRIGA